MPVIPLPSGYTWGFVTARSIHAMADTAKDFDRFPEARGSNGRVTFTPLMRFRVHEQEPTAFVHYEIVRATMRDGNLIDAEEEEGIYLITGYYKVDFSIEGGAIPGFEIEVTAEHTKENPLDLALATPVVVPPGYTEVVRISDRVRAEAAAAKAEQISDEFSDVAAQQAAQAAQNATDEARGYSESASTSATEAANTAQAMDQTLDDFVNDGIPLATETTNGLMPAEHWGLLNDRSVAATPDTVMMRNAEGRTSVADPGHDNHAVNLRTLNEAVSSAIEGLDLLVELPDGVDLNETTEPGKYKLPENFSYSPLASIFDDYRGIHSGDMVMTVESEEIDIGEGPVSLTIQFLSLNGGIYGIPTFDSSRYLIEGEVWTEWNGYNMVSELGRRPTIRDDGHVRLSPNTPFNQGSFVATVNHVNAVAREFHSNPINTIHDLDDLSLARYHNTNSIASRFSRNYPEDINGFWVIECKRIQSNGTVQEATKINPSYAKYVRHRTTSGGTYSAWVQIEGGS